MDLGARLIAFAPRFGNPIYASLPVQARFRPAAKLLAQRRHGRVALVPGDSARLSGRFVFAVVVAMFRL